MGHLSQLRIAMAQINLLVGDIEGNADKIIDYAHRAKEAGADLAVFPELALTGYPPEDLLLRPGLYHRIETALQNICTAVQDIAIVLGYPRMVDDVVFNMAGTIRGGKVEAEYKKQCLPNYSVFDEKRYFNAGDKPCVVDMNGFSLGITICEDIWQPGPMDQAYKAGAGMVINLNASPFHLGKAHEREQVLQQRVSETGIPVAYVNLVGGQDELIFDGGSFIVNQQSRVVQRSPAFEQGLYYLDCRLFDGQIKVQQGHCTPVMEDIQSAYQALVLGVRDYINKNGFEGAVIGLSGGIDSALTLAVAVDALGADRVEAVSMPSRYTAAMSIEDAREEAQKLGVEFQVIPIEPVFNAFLESLSHEFADKAADTTEENIQARCRGVMLMAISNKKGKMVLSTGNKSEMAVGYSTLYGDMVGGFCVLKDVPKTLVYKLSRYRNGQQQVIPERVIDRPPSAELAPDQKDEDSLPPYDVLDAILERYIEQDECAPDIIKAGFDPEVVLKTIKMVDQNEYKRRQAPPGVRITRKAFGRDRRYPITSGFGRSAPDRKTPQKR